MGRVKGKQEIILKSGIGMFIEKGFAKTKVSDIAKNAGIGKGTVYEYFKSKDDLFKGCIDYILDNHIELLKSEIANQDTAVNKLQKFAVIHFRYMFEKNNVLYYFQKECNDTIGESINKLMLTYRKESINIIENIIMEEMINRKLEFPKDGFSPKDMALIYLGAINQFSVGKVLAEVDNNSAVVDEEELAHFVEKLIRMLHSGYITMDTVESIF